MSCRKANTKEIYLVLKKRKINYITAGDSSVLLLFLFILCFWHTQALETHPLAPLAPMVQKGKERVARNPLRYN